MSELPLEESTALRDVLAYVHRERGLDTGQYKETFFTRRLAVRLRKKKRPPAGGRLALLSV